MSQHLSEYSTPCSANNSLKNLRKQIPKELLGFGPKSLSESSGNYGDCACRLQNELDQILFESSNPRYCVHKFHKCLETRGFGLNNRLKAQAIFGSVLRTAKTPRCGLNIFTVRTFRNCRVAFLNCKMQLQIPRFAFNVCQNPHESPTILLTKCERLCRRQLAQEMWGCTLHTVYQQALPRNIR